MPTSTQKKSSLQRLNPETLYDPRQFAYSHITCVPLNTIEAIVHISGQGGENSAGELSDHFETQCHAVFLNVQHALHAANLDWVNIAHMHLLVVDHDRQKHQIIIQYMQQYFPEQQFPACTLIPVQSLALANMLLEIDATAYRFIS